MMNGILLIMGKIFALHLSKIIIVIGTNENAFYEENRKGNVTCQANKNLDVLNHDNQNVCISKDYNVDREPDEEHATHLDIIFPNIKVINVEEKKKRLTIDITAASVWEDNRISILQSKDNRAVRLPSTSKGDSTPVIWNPFATARISRLKKIRYVFDPTKIQMSLVPRQLAQNMFQIDINSATTFLVGSRIDWSFTASCNFNFSTFPFDRNMCLLEMGFLNSNVIMHNHKPNSSKEMDRIHTSDGFDIFIEPLEPRLEVDPILGVNIHHMRFNIAMKRQLSKYIYQYYIPCIAIVTASSFSFIIPLSAIPGRVALMVTQFLTLTNIFINQMVRIYANTFG